MKVRLENIIHKHRIPILKILVYLYTQIVTDYIYRYI